MFQRHRVVLEGRMQVGLRGMAGVAGLGEQREVGEAEALCQCGAFGELCRAAVALQSGVEEGRRETSRGKAEHDQGEA